jgi:stress-induced-phosphoprotein 1
MADVKKKAQEVMRQGDEAREAGKYPAAASHYSEVLRIEEDNIDASMKRAQVYCLQDKRELALSDINRVLELDSKNVEALTMKGEVMEHLLHYKDAENAYRRALTLDPSNQELEEKVKRTQGKQKDVENPFCMADMMDRLRESEKTKAYMEDKAFVAKLEDLSKDPNRLIKHMEDERIVTALAVLLGVNMVAGAGGMSDPMVRPLPETVDDLDDLTGETGEVPAAEATPLHVSRPDKDKSLEEKEKGNAAYKQRDFETALLHYDKAVELDPTNITFLTNKAAVYFEQTEWEQCLKTCELAVERGREHRADFKIIAKSVSTHGRCT